MSVGNGQGGDIPVDANRRLCGGLPASLSAGRCMVVWVGEKGVLGAVAQRRMGRCVLTWVGDSEADIRARVACDRLPVVGTMPVRGSFTRWVRTPLSDRRKARRVLRTVLDVEIPFPVEECVALFVDERRAGTGEIEGLAVVARDSDIERRLAQWEALGLEPVLLDHPGLALWTQSLAELPMAGGADNVRVVVCCADDQAIVVTGRGGQYASTHVAGMSDPNAMVRALGAQLGGTPGVVEWVWAGLKSAAGEEFRRALAGRWPGTDRELPEPDQFLLRALATRALTAGGLRCNFRTGRYAHQSVRGTDRRRWGWAAAAVLLCGLVGSVGGFLLDGVGRARLAGLERKLGQEIDRVAGYHVPARGEHALRVLRGAVDAARTGLGPFGVEPEATPSRLLDRFVQAAFDGGLMVAQLSVSRGSITASGTAPDWRGCEKAVGVLRDAGYQVNLDRREELSGRRIPFSLKAEANRGR